MHLLTRFFKFLKRKRFALAVAREHLSDRDLTAWYPDWMYELMESDEVRNQAYHDAIRDAVSGKVVLEIGTGRKALWAVSCARAGARKVYAIEANRRAYESALEYLKSQGIDTINLIHGFSDEVEISERCNVLVHSLVGDISSCEGMVRTIGDAKRRLLSPDALHIPQRSTTYVVLAEDPELRAAEWALSYGMRGFRSFEGLSFVWFFGFPHAAAISDPQVFEDFVFQQSLPRQIDSRLNFEIQRDGELRGVCFFIRLQVDEARVVDSWASQTAWSTPFVRLKTSRHVRRGDHVEMHCQCDLSGNPSYSIRLTHYGAGTVEEIGTYAWSGD